MQYIIAGIIYGLCLFILPIWAYRKGLKDGMNISQGKPISPIQNPVKTIKLKKEEDAFIEGLNNLLNFDGTPQKEGDSE